MEPNVEPVDDDNSMFQRNFIYMFEGLHVKVKEACIKHKDSNTYESDFSVLHDFG